MFLGGGGGGGLSQCINEWEKIATDSSCVLNWLRNAVSVFDFFKQFHGSFKGRSYDLTIPPKLFLQNSQVRSRRIEFIEAELIERVSTGSLRLWGKMNRCEFAHLFMP